MSARSDERQYRFEPTDRSGVFLGLSLVQAGLLGGGIVTSVTAVSAGLRLPIALTPALIAAAVSFARVGGYNAWEWLPLFFAWGRARLGRGTRWLPPLPLIVTDPPDAPLPPCLRGLSIRDIPWRGRLAIGAVYDGTRHTMTALIPVAGREFILATRSDQEALLAGWGDVLNQFAIDRGVVTHISWTAYTRRSTMDEHLTWLDEHEAVDDADAAIEGYRELVNSAAVGTAEHEVIVSLTVARDRLARQRGGVIESQTALGNALVDSTEAVLRSLRSAGLSAAEPLNTLQVRRLLRTCMEPDAATRALRGTLAERLALTVAVSPGPVALETTWSHLRIDNALHRTYWVATWPRLGMPPSWLEPFLGAADGVRAMTVVFSPVSPYQSRRRIERDLVKLESDAAMKEEKGRRVDARHRRATQSLLTREEELVAGFAEMGYVGLVTVSANTLEDLQRSGDVVEQHAREVGMELRSLVGRQDLAWAAALPFGLAPRNGIV